MAGPSTQLSPSVMAQLQTLLDRGVGGPAAQTYVNQLANTISPPPSAVAPPAVPPPPSITSRDQGITDPATGNRYSLSGDLISGGNVQAEAAQRAEAERQARFQAEVAAETARWQ